MSTSTYIIIGVIAVIVFTIYVVLQGNANKKKAMSGEYKAAVTAVMNKIIPEGDTCTIAYATWEWQTF